MLDTNICAFIMRYKPIHYRKHFEKLNLLEVGISSITLAEIEFGIINSQNRTKHRQKSDCFLEPLQLLEYDRIAAKYYGLVRYSLRHQPIGPMDTLIAAHALSLDCTLITNNLREFKRVPELRVTDWSE